MDAIWFTLGEGFTLKILAFIYLDKLFILGKRALIGDLKIPLDLKFNL